MAAVKNVILKIGAKGVKATTFGLKKVGSGLKSISAGAVSLTKKLGFLGAGFTVLSTKLAGDFQKSLLEITTLLKKDTGETVEDFTKRTLPSLGKELTNVANMSGLALDSLAKAKYDIVSAGFSNAADSAKVLEQSTKLAVGGVTSAAAAADILTSALNAFGEGADQADEVSDALFTTVRLGKTTITELGASLGQVLPFAKSFNLSLESVGAAMATLTAAGVNTAESTTALKGAIVALESPGKAARDTMKELGIEVKRSDDGTVDLLETVKQFEGLDPEVLSKLIPNVRAQLALKTMVNNIGKLDENLGEFQKTTGATETAFDKMLLAFNTQMSILKNNFQTVFIEIGNIIIENVQPFVEDLNTEFKKLNEIGFDNLAAALRDQMPEILNTLLSSFNMFFNIIKAELKAVKFSVLDAFNPFISMQDQITQQQAVVETLFTNSASTIGNMFSNMYTNIVDAAEIAKMKQDLLNLSTGEGGEKTEGVSGKMTDQMKIIGSNLKLRKTEMDMSIKAVDTQNLFADAVARSNFLKQQELQATVKGAILSGQSAEQAMKTVVRAKIMEGVVALVASIFKSVPYPVNLILAAGAGSAVGEIVDDQLAKFAGGGIVQGNPAQGDVVPVMATAGELILNQAQQDNLAGNMGVTINIGGNIIGEESFVRDTLIPEIERARTLA